MAKFKVRRPVELNGTLYLPEGYPAPKKPRSMGNGAEIKVDVSGLVELTAQEAAEMTLGQVQAVPEPASAPAKPGKAKVKKDGD